MTDIFAHRFVVKTDERQGSRRSRSKRRRTGLAERRRPGRTGGRHEALGAEGSQHRQETERRPILVDHPAKPHRPRMNMNEADPRPALKTAEANGFTVLGQAAPQTQALRDSRPRLGGRRRRAAHRTGWAPAQNPPGARRRSQMGNGHQGRALTCWAAQSREARGHSIMRRQQSASLTAAKAIRPLEALNFFMADMQAGIGPFLGVFLLAHRLGERADRHGDDHRRRRRHGDDRAGRRACRRDFAQAALRDRARRLHGAGVDDHSAVAEFLAGRRLAGRDGDRGRGDRAGGGGHDARHRAAGRLQPAERTQPGVQSRRQYGRRGLVRPARLEIRPHRGVLAGGRVRRPVDHFGA